MDVYKYNGKEGRVYFKSFPRQEFTAGVDWAVLIVSIQPTGQVRVGSYLTSQAMLGLGIATAQTQDSERRNN